jgi:hypothetical protein
MTENMDELDLSLQRGPGGIASDSFINRDNYVHRCVVLPKHPHPERPILGVRGILVQLRPHCIVPFDDDVFFSFVGESNRKRKSRKRNSMVRFIAPDSDGESSSSGGTMLMRRQVIPPLTIRDWHRPTYAKESRPKLLLFYNEDSDSSETIASR